MHQEHIFMPGSHDPALTKRQNRPISSTVVPVCFGLVPSERFSAAVIHQLRCALSPAGKREEKQQIAGLLQ